MSQSDSMRIEGFRASLQVRGKDFRVVGSLARFSGLLSPSVGDGAELGQDHSRNVRTSRDIHVLRSDLPNLTDFGVGAVLRSVVLDTAFRVSEVIASPENPVVILKCEEALG